MRTGGSLCATTRSVSCVFHSTSASAAAKVIPSKHHKPSVPTDGRSWAEIQQHCYPELIEALKTSFAKNPSEVQILATQAIMNNSPTIINSPTGTGKTLSYLIPCFQDAMVRNQIAEKIARDEPLTEAEEPLKHFAKHPSALILVPSKDLVDQVFSMAQPFAKKLGVPVYKVDISKAHTQTAPGIWISTAQILESRNEEFIYERIMPKLRYLVVDEADFVLDTNTKLALKLVRKLKLIRKRNMGPLLPVFAGATMPDGGRGTSSQVIAHHLKKYNLQTVKTFGTHAVGKNITQEFIPIAQDEKEHIEMIADAIKDNKARKILVFTNYINSTEILYTALKKRLPKTTSLMKCSKGENTLNEFKKQSPHQKTVLITTDMAARGLDVPDIDLVIQADFALNAIVYLHRVGRTGRFGRPGHVVSFFSPENNLQSRIKEHVESELPLERLFSRRRMFTKKIKKERRRKNAAAMGAEGGDAEFNSSEEDDDSQSEGEYFDSDDEPEK
jgi:superfamily II DNA/RNA helicase